MSISIFESILKSYASCAEGRLMCIVEGNEVRSWQWEVPRAFCSLFPCKRIFHELRLEVGLSARVQQGRCNSGTRRCREMWLGSVVQVPTYLAEPRF